MNQRETRNEMNGIIGHDSALVRLYWAGDNQRNKIYWQICEHLLLHAASCGTGCCVGDGDGSELTEHGGVVLLGRLVRRACEERGRTEALSSDHR